MRGEGGFTLVELLVVLALLGIVLAVAAPALPRRAEGNDAAVGALRRVVDRARRISAEQSLPVQLEIDLGGDAYRIERIGPGGGALLDSGRVRFPSGVRASRASFAASFDPRGRSSGDSLRLRDAAGGEVVLALSPWTGAVRHERR